MTLPIQFPDFEGRAACAEIGGDDWFPEIGGSTREIKRVCSTCEIVEQCLLWALDNKELFGVWGGLTLRERNKLRRQRKPRPINHGRPGGSAAHRGRGEKPCETCRAASARLRREYEAAARKAGAA